jgi:hypothetical protein
MRMAGMSLTRVGGPFDGDLFSCLVTFSVLVIIIFMVGRMNPLFVRSACSYVRVCVCVWVCVHVVIVEC